MFEGSNTDALLGLTGVRICAVEIGAEVTITIETIDDRVGCRSCGVIVQAHARRHVRVRDLATWGRPTVLSVESSPIRSEQGSGRCRSSGRGTSTLQRSCCSTGRVAGFVTASCCRSPW